MITSIAAGAAISPDDGNIVKAIVHSTQLSGAISRSAERTWHVAIRNDEGAVYRRAAFRNANQVRRMAMRMKVLGYADELAGAAGPRDGFDAIFGRASDAVESEASETRETREVSAAA